MVKYYTFHKPKKCVCVRYYVFYNVHVVCESVSVPFVDMIFHCWSCCCWFYVIMLRFPAPQHSMDYLLVVFVKFNWGFSSSLFATSRARVCVFRIYNKQSFFSLYFKSIIILCAVFALGQLSVNVCTYTACWLPFLLPPYSSSLCILRLFSINYKLMSIAKLSQTKLNELKSLRSFFYTTLRQYVLCVFFQNRKENIVSNWINNRHNLREKNMFVFNNWVKNRVVYFTNTLSIQILNIK